jgi:hypothetical protein
MKKSIKCNARLKSSIWIVLLLITVNLIAGSNIGLAATTYLSAVADSYISAKDRYTNFGNQGSLFTGIWSDGYEFRSLLKFDFSSLPGNATITDAELILQRSTSAGNFDMFVQCVKSDWDEYTVTLNNHGGYNSNPFTTINPTTASNPVKIAVYNLLSNSYYSCFQYGFYLHTVGVPTAGNWVMFHSREATYAPWRPQLKITYSVPPQNYSLSVSKNGSGTVTSNPSGINCGSDCSETYIDGTSVTLTATPLGGWSFSGWSGSCNGTGTCVLTMTSNKSVTATFTQDRVLSVSTSGSGTVTSNPSGINCGSDCSETYIDGASVTLTATPSNNWTFSGWSGSCSGTGTCNLTMNANKSVTATFSGPFLPDITVTPTSIPFGNVNTGSSAENTVTVKNDGNANLSIGTVSNPASPFSKISDNCSGKNLSPSASCTVKARFSPTATSTYNSYFNIPSDDPDDNPVTVYLSGTGTSPGSPDISVLPSTTFTFTNVTVGTSADQTLTVKNIGNADLSIFSITQPSAPFEIVSGTDNCSSATLSPTHSCTLDIRFTAATVGTYNSSFDIPSDDPDENPVTINLTGSATPVANNAPSKPNLVYPLNSSSNLPLSFTFEWAKCTDSDGDDVTYLLYYDTDSSFTGTTPIQIASLEKNLPVYAGIGGGAGLLLSGIIFVGGIKDRRKKYIWLLSLIMAVTLIVSCGSGGGGGGNDGGNDSGTPQPPSNSNNKTYAVTGLSANTTYYWKVVADDGNGGVTESDTYSFVTKQ